MTAPVPPQVVTRVRAVSLGHTSYDEAFSMQQGRADALLNMDDEEQTVYTVEHPPTLTIGKSGSEGNILASREELQAMGMVIRHIDRGGDVTYHGPGQVVMYPVLHLEPWGNGIRRYVAMLEETAIEAARSVGIVAARSDGYPGVWVGDNKICAIGVRARRRPTGEFVTTHGIAFNVTTNLSHFDTIVPCGLHDKGVTSVAQELGPDAAPSFADWEQCLFAAFARVFEVEFI